MIRQRLSLFGAYALAAGILILMVYYLSQQAGITGRVPFSPGVAPINPDNIGFGGQSRSNNYEELVDSLYRGNATTTIGALLWVPWFSTSTGCGLADLKSGSSCNSGESIDFTHNCMVTDEFSQVGIVVALGQNQTRMDQFLATVNAIKSDNGAIPAWRVYRSGDTIEPCRSGINGNCDTASDATARIIIALYTASNNTAFAAPQRLLYRELAANLSADFVEHEVLQTCTQSSLGYGPICYWMSAGSGARSGGFDATDFAYTGYYGDGIIAMLQACSQTGNLTYCAVAGNFTLNYLQAANYDGANFRVPPGRSFKWTNTSGVPVAACTNTCGPDQWDYADASRAVGICMANYYASLVNTTLPGLQGYCALWGNRYMNSTSSAPIQYYSNGTNSAGYQSGFFAQGLEAMFQMGGHNQSLFEATLDSALSHYGTGSKTWDNTACFGIYTEAFAMRALGAGIGRDMAGFSALAIAGGGNETNATENNQTNDTAVNISITTFPGSPSSILDNGSQGYNVSILNPSNLSTLITWYRNGTNQTASFNATAYTFIANSSLTGKWNITVLVVSSANNASAQWLLSVNATNSTNQTGNETNETGEPQEESPAPVSHGGGGGGGIVLAPNNSTNSTATPSTESALRKTIRTDFSIRADAKTIVKRLREFYGGAS